ncbi:MAG: dockerin type I repeat-containing protein [Acidobacteriota bacterium]|nr:dockerin type I repeat-containing protein [Acidobacteriota bacterium]
MIRFSRLQGVLSALLFSFTAVAATGQEAPGVLASFNGTISTASQQDTVAFEVDSTAYQTNGSGSIGFIFVMSNAGGSVDPGLIDVESNGIGSVSDNLRRPDTAGSSASVALAALTSGKYKITVRSEHKTTGAYRLDVLLAGDANGDYKVDAADTALISQLSVTKIGEAPYTTAADVDRNGLINGGDRQRAQANLGAAAPSPSEENPLEVSLPMGALELVGGSPTAFYNNNSGLRFSLAGAEFDQTTGDVVLSINGNQVPASSLVITDHLLTANINLTNGRNRISLKAYDTVGRPLHYNSTIWAGNTTLTVQLVTASGSPFLQPATVVATLSDDTSVMAEATTSTGVVSFANMPSRTILIKAKGAGNETGTAGVIGTSGSVQIKMIGFKAPSSISNNDFSLGIAGWDIGTAPVSIVPHQEEITGFFPPNLVTKTATGFTVAPTSLVDQDLRLGTAGIGEQSISRTFTVSPDTTAVRIRYRFITSEVPGGYYGSQFNDYFRVALRSQNGGGFGGENTAMNSLPMSAYTTGGSTGWREITLNVDSEGDTIQADVGVANVGDGFLHSQVVVDFVEEVKAALTPTLAWNNSEGGLDLNYEVLDSALTEPVTISVYFANGAAFSNKLGAAVFTFTVPAGTAAGTHGPEHVPGTDLAEDPAGTTHLIAASGETQVGPVADVRISFGANAVATAVSSAMTDVVKDGLRAAGASVGNITSTARTPADQARAMFNNLTNSTNTVAQNVASQRALYGAGGDTVIDTFVAQTAGMDRATMLTNRATIQAAMVTTMNDIGPETVSRHVGDPAVRSVIDLGYSSFTGGNGPLFVSSATPRVDRLIDEPSNNCYHLEKDVN